MKKAPARDLTQIFLYGGMLLCAILALTGNVVTSRMTNRVRPLFLHCSARLGNLSSFVQYSRKFPNPINEVAYIISEPQSAVASAERVFTLIDAEPEKASAANAIPLAKGKWQCASLKCRLFLCSRSAHYSGSGAACQARQSYRHHRSYRHGQDNYYQSYNAVLRCG